MLVYMLNAERNMTEQNLVSARTESDQAEIANSSYLP